jgi:hypothetical protein
MVACSDASGPGSHTGDIIYVLGETHTVFVVDPRKGDILAAAGPVPEQLLSPVMSSDSSTLFFTGYGEGGAAIYAMHAGAFTVEPWYQLKFPPDVAAGSVWDMGGALAVAPGRGELYDGSALIGTLESGDTSASGRVAIFDTASRSLKDSFGPISAGGLSALPPGPVAPAGGLIAYTFVGLDPVTLCSMIVIDPATRTVVDSIAVPRPPGAGSDYPRSIIVSPDGERVFLVGWYGIYGFDLVTRRLLGSVQTMAYETRLAISPDATKVYLISNTIAVLDSPHPSTTIRVFDRDLSEEPPLTLGKQFGDRAPVLHDLIVSRDNRSLYLEAGNRDFFGQGMLRVLVLDLRTGLIVRATSLGVYGQGRMILGH